MKCNHMWLYGSTVKKVARGRFVSKTRVCAVAGCMKAQKLIKGHWKTVKM